MVHNKTCITTNRQTPSWGISLKMKNKKSWTVVCKLQRTKTNGFKDFSSSHSRRQTSANKKTQASKE